MSHSPEDPDDAQQQALFTQANTQLGELAERGFSWSGNERNCAYLNTHGGAFANVSSVTGFDFLEDGRSLALVDWDHDGDLDIWSGNRTAPRVRFIRNDATGAHHFAAFELEGRSCNRDAIGARIEVVIADRPDEVLIRTLRAGEGFLGQSSKRLHFGLGTAERISRVTVRWPGGAPEDFEGASSDQFHRLVQGTGTAQVWTPPARELALQPEATRPTSVPGKARVFLTSRLPLPRGAYETFEGELRSSEPPFGSPVLINLWASWCQPCIAELAQFGAEAKALDAAGVRVVALSVDGLGADESSSVPKAAALMERLALPFETGLARPEFVDTLQIVHDLLLAQRRPLPVPTSFLLDAQGRVAAIYKGPIHVDQLLADVASLELDLDQQRDAAMPFAGRWMAPLNRKARLLPLLQELATAGHFTEAAQYADEHRGALELEPGFDAFLAKLRQAFRKDLRNTPEADALTGLGTVLGLQGRAAESEEAFRDALRLEPNSADASRGLTRALSQQGEYAEALKRIQDSIGAHPDDATLFADRAAVYSRLGNHPLALADAARVVALRPGSAAAHFEHALALDEEGEHERAVEECSTTIQLYGDDARARLVRGRLHAAAGTYSAALEDLTLAVRLAPENARAHSELAWLLATCPDELYRDGERALSAAQRAGELAGWESAPLLQAYAAACAETGAFQRARDWQKRAVEASPLTEQSPYRAVLSAFESDQPYRSSPDLR